ncbi:MAG: preprotein translocase subunit SecG [Thermodesulfobacteriales bacterium]|nr:MAG: preprotein translocase subunit SecG [Thermodesulfobacteriales bacterium]
MELIIYSVQVIHVLVSILLILVVLLQPGKSGDLGSVFGGGGSSESVFGASGAVPFLSKVTRVLAVLFLLSSLTLGYFAAKSVGSSSVTDIPAAQQTTDFDTPVDVAQPQTSEEQSAPAEVSQDSGESVPTTQGEGQMSSEPETSGSTESSPDDTQGTQ